MWVPFPPLKDTVIPTPFHRQPLPWTGHSGRQITDNKPPLCGGCGPTGRTSVHCLLCAEWAQQQTRSRVGTTADPQQPRTLSLISTHELGFIVSFLLQSSIIARNVWAAKSKLYLTIKALTHFTLRNTVRCINCRSFDLENLQYCRFRWSPSRFFSLYRGSFPGWV